MIQFIPFQFIFIYYLYKMNQLLELFNIFQTKQEVDAVSCQRFEALVRLPYHPGISTNSGTNVCPLTTEVVWEIPIGNLI